MTVTITPPRAASAEAPVARPATRLGLRRAVQVALPALAGATLVAATVTDPGVGSEGREMVRIYAAHVDQLQVHATLLHFSYGLWGLVPVALAPLVRDRGRGLMNAAAVLGFLVMISMPALMMSDLFFAAIANANGLDAAMRIYDGMGGEQWAVKAYLVPGLVGMLLCLPLTFAALARARRTPWWGLALAVPVMPVFAATGGGLVGALLAGALLVGLSALLFRGARD
jgi:hypothetical protein